MSAGRWLALDPLREVAHVDRFGFVELADVPRVTNPDRVDLDPLYRTTRARTRLDGPVPVCVYHDRDVTPADRDAIAAFLRAG